MFAAAVELSFFPRLAVVILDAWGGLVQARQALPA